MLMNCITLMFVTCIILLISSYKYVTIPLIETWEEVELLYFHFVRRRKRQTMYISKQRMHQTVYEFVLYFEREEEPSQTYFACKYVTSAQSLHSWAFCQPVRNCSITTALSTVKKHKRKFKILLQNIKS